MQQRQLGQTGLSVSSIGLGCVTFGREIDRRTSLDILDYAARSGVSLLDTAAAYGDGASEEILDAGNRIRETQPPVDFEQVISNFVFGKI